MNKDNINTVAHRWLKEHLENDYVCIDATCGNGNDTLFLAERCMKVYAFDIQHQAIENTQKRCAHLNNITYFEMSHAFMEKVIHEAVDCIVFNFGYLPKADSSIITQKDSSLAALDASMKLLKPNGYLILCCYVGHMGGQEETDAIFTWMNFQNIEEILTYRQDRPQSPILKIIQKKDA